ncbi:MULTISPECIES: hypothetical protein [unclassified Amycolatopsis]|uniref:hypothetical protein n=1 Tax=unclassified Amycolatopsis TaxID=2618356 RepID=UPI002875DD77|nr:MULTISPECIES: hypothetical protein [unclassified Amycolatopsis]MDS0133695.1 hypothetical protein [Amycolatopsis sp. 505]MDS0148460.1 hypothetical protein [Amycolatopsis sp. CM201R]
MTRQFKSIIDLLDSFFGGPWTPDSVDKLSTDELHSLAIDVDDYYYSHKLPDLEPDVVRSYSGGAAFVANIQRPFTTSSEMRKISQSQLLPFAHSAALYVDQIVVNCPLDTWIFNYRDFLAPGSFRSTNGLEIMPFGFGQHYGAGFHNSDEDTNREQIKAALYRLEVLEPGIRSGWILTVPHLRIWKTAKESIRTQVRKDTMNPSLVETLSSEFDIPPAHNDFIRGLSVVGGDGVVPQDHARSVVESPMIYFNSTLAVAGETDSRFLPTVDSDFSLLRQRVTDAAKLNKELRDGVAVGSLRRVLLPTFDDLTFERICSIRESEASFSEWRTQIRELIDGNTTLREDDMSAFEEIVDDKIKQRVAKIESDIEKSNTLRGALESAKPSKLDLGLAAAVWAIPPQGSILKLIAGVGAPILRAALKSVSSRQNSAQSVVMEIRKLSSP